MVKLDVGCGEASRREGFIGIDAKLGGEAFPLRYNDGSPVEDETVDELVASHILEHFPHIQINEVLAAWVRALKPGGVLRIAVPDFEKIASAYVEGRSFGPPHELLIMGGQISDNDFHKSLFDREHLRQRLGRAGLVLLRDWQSDVEDTSVFYFSLNMEGTKPATPELKISAIMSMPRLAFTDNMFSAIEGIIPLGIKLTRHGGAFWGQSLTKAIEKAIEDDQPDVILTLDYDSVFTKGQVARLIQTLMAHPEADALAALQSSRHWATSLFTMRDSNGVPRPAIQVGELTGDVARIDSAHFGLTLLRVKKLQELPRPWFHSKPDKDGRWNDEGKTDEDTRFWESWRESGFSLYLAPRVVIGHAELMIRLPGKDLQVIYYPVREFNETGKWPDETWS